MVVYLYFKFMFRRSQSNIITVPNNCIKYSLGSILKKVKFNQVLTVFRTEITNYSDTFVNRKQRQV